MRPGQTVAKTATAPRASRSCFVAWCAVAWAGAAGCKSVSGGAVDLSWRLKPQAGFSESSQISDSFVDCNPQGGLSDSMGNPILGTGVVPLTAIRLYWQAGDQSGPPDEQTPYQDFQCSTENGVTSFEIPAGDALLSVAPVCGSGSEAVQADACTYTAPAPVERTMVAGQTVQLGALEIVLDVGTGSAGRNSCMMIDGEPPKQATCICTMKGCPP